ncbi:DUF1090 domain-containing protein [Burkholderia metallica]|uniref:DUF1090 domain-containing protein n=1 Tax=Burkholderia metallica TaxID=488729 RepID=UPI00157A7417
MKNSCICFALIAVALSGASPVFADTRDCATKLSAIEAQISAAKQFGNPNKAAGLQAALVQVRTNCTKAGQIAHAESKIRNAQADVRHVRDEIRQAEDKLRDAQAQRDATKIIRAQRKLTDKKEKLADKVEDLRNAEADLIALKG